MDLRFILEQIDPGTARAFVTASRNVIDAVLIEAERVRALQTPLEVSYDDAGLSRATPAGGWISPHELRSAVERMSEAIAAERWIDGVLAAVKAMSALGLAI